MAGGAGACFGGAAAARDVWLVSAASVPWDVSDAADGRRLGSLAVSDDLSMQRAIVLDDVRLAEGFHSADAGCHWTDGRARLAPELWAGYRRHVFLRLDLAQPCLPAWRAPATGATGLRVA